MATAEERALARFATQFEVTEADQKFAEQFLAKHRDSTALTLYTERNKGKQIPIGLFIIRTAPGLRGEEADGSRETLIKKTKGDLPFVVEWQPFENAPLEVFQAYFASKYKDEGDLMLCKRAIQQENVYTRAVLSRKPKGTGRRNVYRVHVA